MEQMERANAGNIQPGGIEEEQKPVKCRHEL